MAAARPDREDTAPFLLRLFYRQGSFHRPDEFASRSLPPSLDLYTWPTCTLDELACLISSERPALLPSPSIGTRLAFRLIYPDARSLSASSHGQPRFIIKELGSVVIGEGGPGAANSTPSAGPDVDEDIEMGDRVSPGAHGATAGKSTLQDARYVIGDYVSCAILPPLSDGSVAPEAHARPSNAGGPGGFSVSRREAGFGRGEGWNRRRQFGDVPMGDWRRGERLPDDPPERAWGRGSRRGR